MRIKFIDAYFIEILEDMIIVNNITGKIRKNHISWQYFWLGTFPLNFLLLYNKLQLTMYHYEHTCWGNKSATRRYAGKTVVHLMGVNYWQHFTWNATKIQYHNKFLVYTRVKTSWSNHASKPAGQKRLKIKNPQQQKDNKKQRQTMVNKYISSTI